MAWFRVAGREIWFSDHLPELEFIRVERAEQGTRPAPVLQTLSTRARGWVAGGEREVEVWSDPNGCTLKVDGGSDVHISFDGDSIIRLDDARDVTALEREILLGPALLLALASRGTFCLHASAAMFRGHLFVFLGESGQGKSTLAAYLSGDGRGWIRVADDILPVTAQSSRVEAWPRFPQLKVPLQSQPGLSLPEQIKVGGFFVLKDTAEGKSPEMKLLSRGQAVQVLVGQTASARLFDTRLLAMHLDFCAQAARQGPVYELRVPRKMESLVDVKELLESSC